jgi:hypothetical protein
MPMSFFYVVLAMRGGLVSIKVLWVFEGVRGGVEACMWSWWVGEWVG